MLRLTLGFLVVSLLVNGYQFWLWQSGLSNINRNLRQLMVIAKQDNTVNPYAYSERSDPLESTKVKSDLRLISDQLRQILKMQKNSHNSPNRNQAHSQPNEADRLIDDYKDADIEGFMRIEQILSTGELDRQVSLELKATLSRMSGESHLMAIEQLVIAINRGELNLHPGVIL